MLNREELKEIATLQADGSYFVSLYLNVSPGTKGDYVIHLKNMLKKFSEEEERYLPALIVRAEWRRSIILLTLQRREQWNKVR